jgi:hypothetical protein
MNPEYPIYIISKGRYNIAPLTCRSLDRMRVPYRLVVEPCEFEAYSRVVDLAKILQLPFENLGLGSIPARNWVWNHSRANGDRRHWIMDDNIEAFHRLNRNKKPECLTGSIFKAAEDFVDRYSNVALSGFNYHGLCKATDQVPPFVLNTRIYSCTLILNSIDYEWRGIYNEDTDLSLRVLKDGWCTIQFNAFLAGKVTTMRMRGGNTDELYKDDGRLRMAKSLVEQHPDVAKVVWRFGRWHHSVDYRPFRKNKLIRVQDQPISENNEYGMVLKNKRL